MKGIGSASFHWHGDRFKAQLDAAVRAGVSDAAVVLADVVVRGIGRDHGGVPSKPGEMPNSQTGLFSNSIGFTRSNADWFAFVGSNLAYARWLNNGTATMRPRPWATLSISRARQRMILAAFRKARSVMQSGGIGGDRA